MTLEPETAPSPHPDTERELEALRQEVLMLRAEAASHRQTLMEMQLGTLAERDARRAALNLLEDAEESRRRLQLEITEREETQNALRTSEEQFRRAIEEAPIPVIMQAEDGQVLQVSRTWTELTGYSREEMPPLGAWLNEAEGDGADHLRQVVRSLFQEGATLRNVELEVTTRSRERRTWSCNASAPGKLRDGRRFIVAMAVDITERLEAEEALRQSEERMRLIVENAREYAIFALDMQRYITSWNPGAQAILGYTVEEIIGQHGDIIFTEEDKADGAPQAEAAVALASGRAADERWHVRKDGSRFWGSGVMMAMHDENGEAIGFVKIFRDQTDELRAKEALEKGRQELWAALQETERARAEAEAAGKAKDHFLAVLSHELRTPLTPVIMATKMLGRRKDLPEPVYEALEMIRRNILLEAHFVDDLLDVTRIARGKLELVCRPMCMNQAIKNAIEVSQPDFEAKRQQLTVKLEADRSQVHGDFNRLQQVIWNLLKNAAKFTPEEGDVCVCTYNEGERLLIEVKDTGMGIEPDAMAHIFDAFAQASVDVTRKFGGLGLGLAIAKASVEGHEGELWVESEGAGSGATFMVSLPLLREGNDGSCGALPDGHSVERGR